MNLIIYEGKKIAFSHFNKTYIFILNFYIFAHPNFICLNTDLFLGEHKQIH